MKKIISLFLISVMSLGLTGCDFVDRVVEVYKNAWEMTFGTKRDHEEETQTNTGFEYNYDPSAPVKINYIDVDENFDTDSDCFEVTWHFSQDVLNTFLKADADIRIVIKSNDDTIVYDKNYSVTDKDYQTLVDYGEYQFYQGSIKISTSDIEPGTSTSGRMYVYAKLKDGKEFETVVLSVYSHLPMKKMSITASLPATVDIKDYRGQLDKRIEIVALEVIASPYESISYSYQKMTAQVKLIYNKNGNDVNDYVTFGFKIKDSNGVIVGSGMCMTGRMKVGETINCDIQATGKFDLKKNYTIEFEDSR